MRRKPRELTLSFDSDSGTFVPLTGVGAGKPTGPGDLEREYYDAPLARPGASGSTVPFRQAIRRPQVYERLSAPPPPVGSGWGAPIWARFKNHGTAKKPDYRYVAIPVGAVALLGGGWVLERVVSDVSSWLAGSGLFGKPRPVPGFLSWLAGNVIPSGADIHALSETIHSAATGGGPGGSPAPPASGTPSGSSILVNGITYIWNGSQNAWTSTIG